MNDARQSIWLQALFQEIQQGANAPTAVDYANTILAAYDAAFPVTPPATLTAVPTTAVNA